MSNTPFVNEHLRKAAEDRASKQFPEFSKEEVLSAVAQEYSSRMGSREKIDCPMRELRQS